MSGRLSMGDRTFRRSGTQCLMLVQYALRTYTNAIRERTANVNPELPDTVHDVLVSWTGKGRFSSEPLVLSTLTQIFRRYVRSLARASACL